MKKIALDTNVFRDIDFINYLIKRSKKFQVFLPSIVGLELGYYRSLKNISWDEFNHYISKFNGSIIPWESIDSNEVINNAKIYRSTLPFSHHFRDFLIGTQCVKEKYDLITKNVEHFNWITSINVQTPEMFFSINK
jgi:predicted nucleic acid-binding protein